MAEEEGLHSLREALAKARRQAAFAEARTAASQRLLEEAIRFMTDEQLVAFRKRTLFLDAGDIEQPADVGGDSSPDSPGAAG